MMPEALLRQDVSSSLSISNAEKEAAGTNSKSVKWKSLGNNASLDYQTGLFKRKSEVINGCSKLPRISLDDDLLIRESSHLEGGQEIRKNPQADSDAESPARITPSKTILRNSSGLKGKDVPAGISYLNTTASPAKDTTFKTTRTKSPGFNCKNVIGDVAVSKTPTPEIVQDEDFDVVQRPEKNYRETSLVTKVDKSNNAVMQVPVLTNSFIYGQPQNMNGIPGAKSLVVCLTGYRGDYKANIILMVLLMGAKYSGRLDNTVTHLMCYKFEGQKYQVAKRKKTVKLVNHKWLEDCSSKWEIVPEKDYNKSSHELKMEAEALLKQAVPSNAGNVVSATIKSSSDFQKSCAPHLENTNEAAGTNSKCGKQKSLGKNASLDDENGRFKRKSEVSNGCSKLRKISLDDDLSIRESSHVEGSQELRKNPQADSDAKIPVRITPSKTILRNSSGLKGKDTPDVSYLKTSAAASPAKYTAFKTTETKSPGFNCKNVIGDVAVSKTPTPEIVQDEDFDVVERHHKDSSETSLVAEVDKSDTGVAVTEIQGPVLTNSFIYGQPRNMNGIPGAKSLVVCSTGYRGDYKANIILMVLLMGAKYSVRLDNTVTHLMCYKFEGEKYQIAERKKTIKLVNHKWLEDCSSKWEIVPEKDYNKSGHELKMEAEALLKQAVPRSRGFSSVGANSKSVDDEATVTNMGNNNDEVVAVDGDHIEKQTDGGNDMVAGC